MNKKVLTVFLMIIFDLAVSTMETQYGTAYVRGTAELDCNAQHNTEQPIPDYHWQKDREVLFELKDNVQKEENVNKKYLNRTRIYLSRFNLLLDDVTVDDEGTYTCFIFSKINSWREKTHEHSITLKVKANFTVPEIFPPHKQNVKKEEIIQLECLSKLGYPKPEGVVWIISNSSGTHEISTIIQIDQDPITKLFNISTNISLQIEESTNISCIVSPILSSDVVRIEIDSEDPPGIVPSSNNHLIICTIVVLVVVLTLIGFVIFMQNNKANCQGGRNRSSPAEQSQENGSQLEQVVLMPVTANENC